MIQLRDKIYENRSDSIGSVLYLIKIHLNYLFVSDWLKITHIIHHNQLLLTKFGRILPYSTDDVKKGAKLQIIQP